MSEPIFEASVRLRADVGDFEQQAQASLQQTTQRLEQQAQQAGTRIQQTLAQGSGSAGGLAADLEKQLAQTRALAAQPLQLEVIADTEPFDRAVNQSYQRITVLAEQNVAQLQQIALEGAEATKAATEQLANASGFAGREQAQAALAAAQEARRIAEQAVADARFQLSQIRGEAQAALHRPAEELQTLAATAGTRAGTAGLLGDVAGQQSQLLQQEIFARQAGLELLKLQQLEFAQQLSATSGVERDALLAQAESAAAAAGVLRREILQLQTTGRLAAAPPGAAPGEPPGGFFSSITGPGGLLRSRSGTSSLAGILGTTARFGLAGLAFSAAFTTLGELQRSLRKTGDEAFTLQGRISNLGAELLSGNVIGGFKALTAAQKATFEGGLADKLTAELERVHAAESPLVVTEEKLALVRQKGRDVLQGYIASLLYQGHITQAQAVGLLKVSDETEKQTKITEAAADAWANYSRQVELAGGSLEKAFGPDSAGGPRGPGSLPSVPAGTQPGDVIGRQRTGIPRDIIEPDRSVFRAGTGGQDVANQIRESIISRIQDSQAQQVAELRHLRIVQAQKRTAFELAKESAEAAGVANQAASAYKDLVAATTAVKNQAALVAATAQANAEAIRAAGDRARDARASAIADPTARLQAQLANAQIDEREAATALAKAKRANKSARDIAEANAVYEEAVAARASIEEQIAANAKAAADAARDDARNAHELRLANNIAAAALTATKADDKRYYNEAIDYYRSVARDGSRTATEREQARGTVRQLRQGLKEALGGGGGSELQLAQIQNALAQAQLVGSIPLQRRAAQRLVDFWEEQVSSAQGIERAQARASLIAARGTLQQANRAAVDLQEQRIQNRVAAARLTEGLGDDQRAADALVKFWQEQVKHAQGVEKVRAQSSLIAAKLARQSLEESEKATTTVFDLLSRTAQRFAEFSGNLIDKNNPFTKESFVAEQAQFFRPGVTPEQLFAGPTGFMADLNAFRERNDRLSRIPGSGIEATDRNTDAINRLTDTLTGRIPGIQRGDSGSIPTGRRVTPEEAAGLRGEAMGTFWKARQARMATESGVGAAGAGF